MQMLGDDLDLLQHQHHDVPGLIPAFSAGQFLHVIYGITRFSGAKTIVELGVAAGSTSTLFAQIAKLNGGHAWGIDKNASCENIVRSRLKEMSLLPYWTFLAGPTETIGQRWTHGAIDSLLIDASHEGEDVERDLRTWAPHVSATGFLFIHDVRHHGHPEAEQAFDAFVDEMAPVWESFVLPYWMGLGIMHRRPAEKPGPASESD